MWRFFVLPLLTSAAVVIESTVYILSVLTLWYASTDFPVPSRTAPSLTLRIYLDSYHRIIANTLTSKWPYLVGAGLLLGLALAGWGFVRSKTGAGQGLFWILAQNSFWFGLYTFVLTAPPFCAFFYGSQQYAIFLPWTHVIVYTLFPWSGFFIVLLAGVYSLNSNQVFSPKTIVRRLRYGRFNTSTSAN